MSFKPSSILVTGGAGFIGGHFVRHMLKEHSDVRILNLDKLTYAGNLSSLADVENAYGERGEKRYRFVRADICDRDRVETLLQEEGVDCVVHFAAESHVDRSIHGPAAFLESNVMGTFQLLEACRTVWSGRQGARFHHVSTDEVYGSLGSTGAFTEETPYDPSSPYSSSKAASDHLVRAWNRTYGLDVTITNCSNNYGPCQFPEKLIPLVILNCLEGKPLPVYGQGSNIRDWLHVQDHCRAIDLVVHGGQSGRTYNVGGSGERTNLEVVFTICDAVDRLGYTARGVARSRDLVTFVQDRPGHDFRYAIDASRIRGELGWNPCWTFEKGLEDVVRWYATHLDWADEVRSGQYREYYTRQYGEESRH